MELLQSSLIEKKALLFSVTLTQTVCSVDNVTRIKIGRDLLNVGVKGHPQVTDSTNGSNVTSLTTERVTI